MKTFTIYTIGCKVNTFESESYRQELLDHGLLEVGVYDADIVLSILVLLPIPRALKVVKEFIKLSEPIQMLT